MASSDILHLTDATPSQAKFVLFNAPPIDSSKGLSVTFDFYEYGGVGNPLGSATATGGDGIGFFLIDGKQLPTNPGGYGGSFGYAPGSSTPGIAGGYLGVAFDAYGNFSSAIEGRVGGPGGIPNSVAVRGSQATQYTYLTGTGTLSAPISNAAPGASRANSGHKAEIDLSPQGLLTVKVDLNRNGTFTDPGEVVIDSFNVIGTGKNEALPSTLRFAFSGATGAATNIHEIGNYTVTTYDKQPIPGSFTNDLLLVGGSASNPSNGSNGGQADALTGGTGNDIIIGGSGSVETGNRGSDRFVFRGATKAEALRRSTLRSQIRITDFNQAEGDRIQLDFDNNLNTRELPKALYYAGTIKGSNLTKALKAVYADKSPQKKGNQALKPNEAVFFKLGKRTYLSINDTKAPFSGQTDLVADVTGMSFKPGDTKKNALHITNYFA